MRKVATAIVLSLVIVSLVFTQAYLSTIRSNGGNQASDEGMAAKNCPCCNCVMKFCQPPGDVEWICKNCGHYELR
jgi:hypothetical protein